MKIFYPPSSLCYTSIPLVLCTCITKTPTPPPPLCEKSFRNDPLSDIDLQLTNLVLKCDTLNCLCLTPAPDVKVLDNDYPLKES